MQRDLSGKRIIITGASCGIGLRLAEQAALQGAQVALAARSAEKLQELSAALNDKGAVTLPIPTDITNEADRRNLLKTVVDEFGGLDILVNNAGIASFGHFADSSEDILRQIMEVNFFAPTELIRLAIPALTMGRQPAVVNIASFCGRRGFPAWSEYCASKFALCGLTEALRGELSRFDIDVLLILPGLTHGETPRQLLRNDGRMNIRRDEGLPAEAVAASILDALKKNRAEKAIGRDARWIVRTNRFLPGLVDRIMIRRVRQLYADSGTGSQSK
jgi:short-subunit dehydrogenase